MVSLALDLTVSLSILSPSSQFDEWRGADGWLNELKNLAAAFKDDAEVSAALKPFYIWSMLASLGLMGLLAWSPVGVWTLTVSHASPV